MTDVSKGECLCILRCHGALKKIACGARALPVFCLSATQSPILVFCFWFFAALAFAVLACAGIRGLGGIGGLAGIRGFVSVC
ncbi:hypothetical protein [Paraburkholderia azotifigens]|uniref:Uncharacterized protein n=1 Tax=Paraburkholderia azotifigens TaxID=2057004 RepID=A0ABU9REQ0_9BURK|nr:hypothetical protein [Paraburkholderia azotifigens]